MIISCEYFQQLGDYVDYMGFVWMFIGGASVSIYVASNPSILASVYIEVALI